MKALSSLFKSFQLFWCQLFPAFWGGNAGSSSKCGKKRSVSEERGTSNKKQHREGEVGVGTGGGDVKELGYKGKKNDIYFRFPDIGKRGNVRFSHTEVFCLFFLP